MNKLLISTIAALGLVGTPAFAADMAIKMPVKAPPPAPAPVYSWTGWYVGGNVGGSWGDAGTDIAGNGTTVSSPGTATAITNPPVAFADSGTQRLSGVIGGGQFGYNLQFSPQWVLGFEADIQASSERGSSTLVDPFSGSVCNGSLFIPPGPAVCNSTTTLNGTAVTSLEAKIDWFGTVRARLGYLVSDQLLVFGTGGLAYGQVSVSGNSTVTGTVFGTIPITPGATSFSASKTNVGFAVGGGMEGRFSYWLPANWTWKLEYLYIDLGSFDTANPFPAAATFFTSPFAGSLTTHTHFTDNILRVGLNYQFH